MKNLVVVVAVLALIGSEVFLHAQAAPADASPPDMWAGQGTVPVPEGAKVTLVTDKQEYLLGENVLVDFTLENTGKEPFGAEVGGDYRGCDRSLRFKVTATDDQGKAAASPDPQPMCMGGLGTTLPVKPGEKLVFSIAVTRYCQFDHPGRYTIRISHDFGWKEGARKIPVGETTISFRMPTETEAAQVVDAMEKLPDDPTDGSWGKKSSPYADFRCLRYPIYLKILQPLAQKGDARALEAIGKMPSSDATQTLIDLSNGSDPKQSLDAALTLNQRLPDPEFAGKLGARGPFNVYGTAARKQLSQLAWDPKFTEPVRALGAKFLVRSDKDSIGCGAFMIETVGQPTDTSQVFKALDAQLNAINSQSRRNPKDDVLDYPGAIPELVRALKILQAEGYDNSHPSGNAQILGYFLSFVDKPGPRPAEWHSAYEAFGASNPYPLRQTALESIPIPLSDDCVKFVKQGLADDDYGVCRTACEIAGKSGRKEFLKPILEIIVTENEEWLLRSAGGAAYQLGGRYDELEAWANRLTDTELTDIALDNLVGVLDGLPSGWSGNSNLTRGERVAIRDAWQKFLAAHVDELKKGKKFRFDDPAVSRAMFGRARTWQLPNGTMWPMTYAEEGKVPSGP